MARRTKKKQSFWSRLRFWETTKPKRGRKTQPTWTAQRIWTLARVLVVVAVLGALAFAFVQLDHYIKTLPDLQRYGNLELYGLPAWARQSPALQDAIRRAVGSDLPLTEQTAEAIGRRLETLPWLYDVHVQTTTKTIKVRAGYRQPRALIRRNDRQWHIAWISRDDPLYVPDQRRVVLIPALDIQGTPIVEITGFTARPPQLDTTAALWSAEEIVSTVELLAALDRMDHITCPDQPLLAHIARIDVANFNGRKAPKQAHVTLFTHQGTEIYWGAAFGQAATYSESSEQEKIASLYTFYKKHGRLDGIVKYIDLRIAQILPPRPPAP